jgi:phage shock protein C
MPKTTKKSAKVKRITLSKKDKVVTGLIGGIAEYYKVNSTSLRILLILLAAASGFFPIIIAYFVAAVVVSQQSI